EDHFQNDHNNFELKNRHKERKPPDWNARNELNNEKVDFIFHEIKPNDTLQGIALRYNCTTAKLRLYNHLMSDQDFYGISYIKIPVIKNSVLKETLGNRNDTDATQFVDDLVDISSSNSSTPPKTQVINIGISNYLNSNGSENYEKFLNILSEDF